LVRTTQKLLKYCCGDEATQDQPQRRETRINSGSGGDVGLADDLEESFRIFQDRIIEAYESMVEEFGLVVDASLPIAAQPTLTRQVVAE
jgi:hypothetical protein